MTDIRTRIAAAIKDVDDTRVCKLSDADIKFMADAVVAVLNESVTECWDLWPARRCVILGTVDA